MKTPETNFHIMEEKMITSLVICGAFVLVALAIGTGGGK